MRRHIVRPTVAAVLVAAASLTGGVAIAAHHVDRGVAVVGSGTKTVPVGNGPIAVAVDSSTHMAFVASDFGRSITPVSTVTGHASPAILLPASPADVAVDPATGRLFVSLMTPSHLDLESRMLLVYSESGQLVKKIDLRMRDARLAVDSRSGLLFAVGSLSRSILVVNIATLSLRGGFSGIPLPPFPQNDTAFDVAVDPTTRTVWVSDAQDNRITGFTEGGGSFAEVNLAYAPYDLSIDPSAGLLWTTFPTQGKALALSIAGGLHVVTTVGSVAVGNFPEDLAIDTATHVAYAVDDGGAVVYPVDERTLAVGAPIAVGGDPRAIGMDSQAGTAVVADSATAYATVIFDLGVGGSTPSETPTPPVTTSAPVPGTSTAAPPTSRPTSAAATAADVPTPSGGTLTATRAASAPASVTPTTSESTSGSAASGSGTATGGALATPTAPPSPFGEGTLASSAPSTARARDGSG